EKGFSLEQENSHICFYTQNQTRPRCARTRKAKKMTHNNYLQVEICIYTEKVKLLTNSKK
ncbi:hypothetical protein, partial [Pseudomonas poae]|uniref:hypothetical protein n=1 Tax=Pseudomonas poae TaxID=200451 RepID=UPI001C8316E8